MTARNYDSPATQRHTMENRDAAFIELHQKGELQARELEVLQVIRHYGPISNRQIARKLELDTTSVGPRTLALRQKGYVVEAKRDKEAATGKTVSFWQTAPTHYVQPKLL